MGCSRSAKMHKRWEFIIFIAMWNCHIICRLRNTCTGYITGYNSHLRSIPTLFLDTHSSRWFESVLAQLTVCRPRSPGSGSGRPGRTGLLIPAGHAYSWMVFTASMTALEVGDQDLRLIIRFVLLRIQTSLDHEPLPCDALRLNIDGARSSINKSSAFAMGGNMSSFTISVALGASSSVSPAASSGRGRSAVTAAVPVSSVLWSRTLRRTLRWFQGSLCNTHGRPTRWPRRWWRASWECTWCRLSPCAWCGSWGSACTNLEGLDDPVHRRVAHELQHLSSLRVFVRIELFDPLFEQCDGHPGFSLLRSPREFALVGPLQGKRVLTLPDHQRFLLLSHPGSR